MKDSDVHLNQFVGLEHFLTFINDDLKTHLLQVTSSFLDHIYGESDRSV